MAASKRKLQNDEIERRLAELNPSEPTNIRSFDEPKTHRPPPPPQPRIRPPAKPKGIDPFEAAKQEFRVDLFELLHWQVPMELQGEITRGEKASFYLVLDKCFQLLATGKLEHWGVKPLDGKAQAMYLWFYWESYGKGFKACPMGNGQLQKLLGWTRNTIKDVLHTLQEYGKPLLGYGIVSALPEFPPFEFTRPQVYRVHLPREFIAAHWRKLEDKARRETGIEGITQLKAALERNPEMKEILPFLAQSASSSASQLA